MPHQDNGRCKTETLHGVRKKFVKKRITRDSISNPKKMKNKMEIKKWHLNERSKIARVDKAPLVTSNNKESPNKIKIWEEKFTVQLTFQLDGSIVRLFEVEKSNFN